ncbi:MAG: DUF4105 domain-containing protein [Pseudomonadota bacterium]
MCSLALAGSPAHANPSLDELAADAYWLRLLRSEASQPRQALNTTLAAFSAADNGAENTHALCLYPARAHWLKQQRPDLAALWPQARCPQYESWLRDLKPGRVTLVYASDFAGNPSSLFGHTLLRIDGENQRNDLLAYAINFSADSGGTGGLSYALQGMTGQFPGSFSLLPYYDKVREYNDLESRDLWQYELNLSPEESRQMARVYWDWRAQKTAYYFLRENCSYELLGLLDATRPSLNLQAGFTGAVIPTDTVRAIVSAGLVTSVSWRASTNTRLNAQIDQNSEAVNAAVKQSLTERSLIPLQNLPAQDQAQALETAHDAQYRRFNQDQRSDYGPWFRQLLIARNQLALPEQRPQPPTPTTRPDQSHRTGRWGLGILQEPQSHAVLLHYRPAYHDLLDDPAGYRPGSQVSILDTTLRLSSTQAGRKRLGLDRFTLLAVDTFTPVDALTTPLSWSILLGAQRHLGDSKRSRWHTQPSLDASVGLTRAVAASSYCHAQIAVANRFGSGLTDGWDSRIGPRLGCFGQWPRAALQWHVDSRYLLGRGQPTQETELGMQWGMNRTQALRLSWQHEQRESHNDRLSLSWLRYF